MLIVCMLAISGCNSSQPVAEKDSGRVETKKLEGASAVGYDGAAIRKSVDNTLDKNDNRGQEMDKVLKNSGDGQK